MAAQDRPAGGAGDGSNSDADLAGRLDRLTRELAFEERQQAAAEPKPGSGATGYAAGFRLASEFVAGVLVGAAIGWGLDRFAGTSPWGLIGFLLLGFAAGVLNAIRVASRTTSGGSGTNGPGV